MRITGLFLLLALTVSVVAQEQITEEQVNREKMFIEANREKLMGNLDNAIQILRELLRQDGKNAAVAYELGRLLEAKGDTEDAIKHLKMAAEIETDNEWYTKHLADLYMEEGRNQEGAALYERLAKQSPSDTYIHFKWAFFLVKAQRYDEALSVYDNLEKRIGLNEEIIRRKHTLYVGMGDNKKAAKELERLANAFPTVLEYQHLLASFYESIGDSASALSVYQRIAALDPEDPKARIALTGGSNMAANELRYMEELQPIFERPDVDVDLKISKLYPFITKVTETRDTSFANAALQLTDRMEKAHSGNAKPFAAAGDLYYHSGRLPQAIEKYEATLERDENVFPVWQQLLTAYYEMGDMQGLFRKANDALDVFPNRAIIQFYLAIAADGLKKYDQALDAISMADMMSGRDNNLRAEVKALEGTILLHQGKEADAGKALAEAVQLAPNAPEVNYRYGLYLLATDNLKNANQVATKAVNANPSHPYYAFGLAQIHYRANEFDKAATLLEKAATYGAYWWPDAQELLGDTQFKRGQVDEAVRHWQRALQLNPQNTRLSSKIANRSL
ncbi:MAG: tetratricopeptide repeat protein [Saprospiraceae bacterium]